MAGRDDAPQLLRADNVIERLDEYQPARLLARCPLNRNRFS